MCICEPKRKLKRNYSAMENTETGTMTSTADIEEDEESASAAAGTAMEVAPSPVITASYYSKDVSDPFATPGQCGLYNLGNTCFMNAGLQCLLSTTPLLKFFLEQFTLDACTKDTLTTYFYQLVRKIWSGQYSIVYPRDFKNALGLFHVQFQDFRQHDCQEFLVLFLDTLHQQLKQEEEAVQNNLQRSVTVDNRDQLNNSIDAKSYSEDGDTVLPSTLELPSFPSREDSETVSYVIQSELPTLLRSVVRTDSSGDLEKSQAEVNELEPILNNVSNLKQRIPKIEEFYAKDTKTLNTNVLSEDFGKDDLATDSEKFPKQELNIFAENDLAMHVPVEAVAVAHTKDDSARKGPKNTNIQAEKFNKMQKGCEMDAEGDGIVKKMKFECTEKNFQINVQSKLNKDLEIDEQKLKLAQLEMDGVNLRKDLRVQKSLDSDMCDSIMKTHLLEDKCPPCAAPDGDYMRTAVKTKKKNCEDCVQNTEKQAPKNGKSKKSQLSENSSKKFKCEMKHEGSPAGSILSTDNEDDREEGGFQNSETTEGDLMEREEEVQADTEEEAAEKAWENYIRDNHSVIISTFQGQFKSTVVCSECSHVSVTFEPFMYLSVPLPHASDRQICVLFVPLEGVSTQYLITLQKSDKVSKLKEQLRRSIGRPVGDIILAEALDNHISRILEENISMQYVNDTTRMVYAYEMPPCPAVPDESPEPPLVLDFSSLQDEANQYSATQTSSEGDIFSSMGTFSRRDVSDINKYMRSSGNAPEKQKESSVTSQTKLSSGEQLWAASAESTPQGEQTDTHWAESQNSESWSCNHAASHWSQAESDQLRKNLNKIMDVSGTGMWNQNYSAGRSPSESTSDWMNGCSGINESGDTASGWDLTQNIQYEETLMKSDPLPDSVTWNANTTQAGTGWDSTGAVATPAAATVVTDKWKSCAICLEELEDSELLCHKLCGGTFCQTCLEMSIKHCVEDSYVCPVCSSAAIPSEDFCPVGSSSTHNLRLLVVPVTLRDESGSFSKLVGHPRLVYLHNTMNGTQLYDSVLNLFPSLAHSTIVFTDGQGLRCSRCQYSEQCQGCPISRDSSVHLRPGDCLSVCMSSLSETCRAELEAHVQDETMEQLRPEKTLTIYDCLQAFTDSEDLDEHNPWYCPRCQRNQCAKKTITVWQYPDTLILHLKRFVYHDLSSNKVDAEVEYPLQDLNLSQYTSGPDSGSLTYDLYSIVCHFGGANAGHYTTFAKHPLNGQWYYYNDESVSQQSPKKEDFKNAYILFYSRQGTDVKFDLPKLPMDQPNILRETLNNRTPLAALPIPSNSGKGLLPDHLMAHSDYDEVDKDRESSPQREQMTQ